MSSSYINLYIRIISRTFIGIIRRKTKRPSKVPKRSFHGMRAQSLSFCFAFTFSRKCQYTIFRTFDLDFVLGKTGYVDIKDMRLGGFAYICVTLSSVYVESAEESRSFGWVSSKKVLNFNFINVFLFI